MCVVFLCRVCGVSVCVWWVCLCVVFVFECGGVVCVWFVVGVVRLCGLFVWFVCVLCMCVMWCVQCMCLSVCVGCVFFVCEFVVCVVCLSG